MTAATFLVGGVLVADEAVHSRAVGGGAAGVSFVDDTGIRVIEQMANETIIVGAVGTDRPFGEYAN
jgi:hypothetical protein